MSTQPVEHDHRYGTASATVEASEGLGEPGIPTRPGTPPEVTDWPGVDHHTTEEDGLLIERDIPVGVRDGVRLRVDLFRPAESGETALPTLIAWAPYGKHGNLKWDTPLFAAYDLGFDTNDLSGHTPFEYPDPKWWCARGYAVLFADMRGTWGSEGSPTYWSQQEAHDGYDLIEWAAQQPWSTGRVGLIGCSNLAWAQWYIAASRPPHLAAINPWEGVSDFYREFAFHGGIPERNFTSAWHTLASFSHNEVEDIPAAAAAHPLIDEYWESKGPRLEDIEVPAFVAASWSDHGLHTRGSLEGFRRISSAHKWLLVHGGKKWAAQYSPENLDRQLAFFDRFVKGLDHTAVDDWPPVTLEIREGLAAGNFRAENEWPLARTRYEELFLAADATLTRNCPQSSGAVRYDATIGSAVFDFAFDEDTELTGHMSLRLWLGVDDATDADIFVGIQKLDGAGSEVPFNFFSVQEDGHVALGWLRASHRALDENLSTPAQPVHTHRSADPLPTGAPVRLDIEIWPSSTIFRAGETLRVVVQGRDLNSYEPMTPTSAHETINTGTHVIHFGADYGSHLLVPVVGANR